MAASALVLLCILAAYLYFTGEVPLIQQLFFWIGG
jgi:hypothetical protein